MVVDATWNEVEILGADEEDDLVEAEGNGEIIELEDVEEDCAPCRIAIDPGAPTPEQVEEHRAAGHCPYRSWCEECVEGRGVGQQHKSGPKSKIPIVSFDYLLVTRRGIHTRLEECDSEILLKILVVKDSLSRTICAHTVPCKGVGSDGYAVEKLKRDILWLGYSRVTLKSDNERAIVALMREALRSIKVDVVDQASEAHPASYDSKHSGSVENAVKLVQGLVRTFKADVEKQIKKRIPATHPLMSWMVEHAAWILTVRLRGQDGHTAYERIWGKPFSRPMVSFGEAVLFSHLTKGPQSQPDGNMGAVQSEAPL